MPILKRDLYALLVWFLLEKDKSNHDFSNSTLWSYDDMFGYTHYLNLFRQKPIWLPRPINKNFYPNAYTTREEFVNLMLIIAGGEDQISTSMHLKSHFKIPRLIYPYIPSYWRDSLAFVTKKEVIKIFDDYFKPSYLDRQKTLVINYKSTSSETINSSVTFVNDRFKRVYSGIRAFMFSQTGVVQATSNMFDLFLNSCKLYFIQFFDQLLVFCGFRLK